MLPSPIHHGLHSDRRVLFPALFLGRVAIPYSSRVAFGPHRNPEQHRERSVAIPYSSRVAFGLKKILAVITFCKCCHPLFITGCIRTEKCLSQRRGQECCHPLFITGCIRTLITFSIAEPPPVAIPYSSRVAFGRCCSIRCGSSETGCHPLFITGCIRTMPYTALKGS